MPEPLSRTVYSQPTFEEFREAAKKERGYPVGAEMLKYIAMHPDQQKVVFPNPARMVKA
jgi:hypothetical protein